MYPKPHSLTAGVVTACLVVAALVSPAAAQEPAARFYGLLVNMQSEYPGQGTTPVNIVVNRWSTDEEQERVTTTVLEQGPKALLSLLGKMPAVGSVAPIGGVGFNVPYATMSRGPDGLEHILILSDRPMSFLERWYGGRSTDYPFLLIEMTIKPDGNGEGQVIVAGRLSADKFNKTLVIENLEIQPMQLRNLKRER